MTENLNAKIEIVDINEENNYGKFVVTPLDRGFGITLGNSLRRVLLSSLPGAAVSKIHIEDVLHEFTTVKGVMEDVSEIILNIKGIAIKNHSAEPVKLNIDIKGPHIFTAKDIEIDTNIEVANPDHYIASLNEDAHIKMTMEIENGKGYRVSDLNKSEEDAIGVIAIDSSFTPVTKVNFEVIEQVSNKEKLELEVWTNGTINPQEAVSKGADILTNYLELFIELPNYSFQEEEEEVEDTVDKDELYSISIEELDLSLRSFNCLKRAGIDTVGDIVSKTTDEMCKIKNFGKKSLEEVENKIHGMGLLFANEEEA
ncbi:DNA-directed RNA polymerase subunit alpha [Miniphocaeibacter halophilus]|uniref:DNA-directed RNA polymerase subunit alpha n=1 Tax=Miniphocaeibacter halophilus TaxID=2931922 RepID=A0AC61MUX9_9FIRM|nr:DNA-directed RNA polymerase subunit alpha [Miniphocaeibacter halophilus]QQK07073.1 DNA-directed RNA polymerase subunit alpha [Miniphocaeibacter halophilus]